MKTKHLIKWIAVFALALSAAQAQTPPAAASSAEAQAQPSVPVNLSPGAAEVIRLATSGVGDDVVLAFIQNSQAPFNLSADDVLYLKDVGLSSQVTSAMLNHDSTLRNQAPQYAPAATAPASAPAPATPAAPTPQTSAVTVAAAPAPTYVTTAPPEVTYFYNDLSPYGTWVYLEGYGWCWQPTRSRDLAGMAALLRWWLLGVHRCRVVLAVHLLLGLGAVPLWPLVCASALRLGLDARTGFGGRRG